MGTSVTGGAAGASFEQLVVRQVESTAWHNDVGIIALGVAAALFVVAGVVRLARLRLSSDAHSALAGSALIVMGGLYLPLMGISESEGVLHHADPEKAVARALLTALTAGLVLRASRGTRLHSLERPSRLIPLLAAVALTSFAGVAGAGAVAHGSSSQGPGFAQWLSAAMVLTWLALAVAVLMSPAQRSWSRRTAPLLAALAVAEAFYGRDPGAVPGTATALAVCAAVGAMAIWSASRDLGTAVRQNESDIGRLSQTLREVRDEAGQLTEWRTQLVHDADNAVAGLRAAVEIISTRQGQVDPRTGHLCQAAAEEIHHLDHLLHRQPDEPSRQFDVAPVVGDVALTARALGAEISFDNSSVEAVGRPGDLAVVLKNLLANSQRHAQGAAVELTVEPDGEQVAIICRDDGPGVDGTVAPHIFERGVRGPRSAGAGLGLYEARLLMRAQGGDLELEPRSPGACFVATLPAPRMSPVLQGARQDNSFVELLRDSHSRHPAGAQGGVG